ncbi:MAG: InlB B-repeat-containing protein [Paludibacteraceae bacterium]
MKRTYLTSILAFFLLVSGAMSLYANEYWYRGAKYNNWETAVALTVSTDGYYEYIEGTYNGTHSFKICLNAADYVNALDCDYTSSGFHGTDITDMNSSTNHWDNNENKNVEIYNGNDDTYYILVYYPNTTINTTDKPIICASTFLPDDNVYYTVKFHANGHGSDPEKQKVVANTMVERPEMTEIKWYELEGWYTDEACTDRWIFENAVTKDMDLYAHWINGNYPTMAVLASFLDNWNESSVQKMTKSEDGKSASYTHTFTEAVTAAEFGLRESKDDSTNEEQQADWWALQTAAEPITASTTVPLCSENSIGEGNTQNIQITVSEPQDITFTFDYETKELTVTYAKDNLNTYRLVYVEELDGTPQVFHPSHTIAAAEEGTRTDTISLYIKPFERKAEGSNPNNCYVVLQQMTGNSLRSMDWVESRRIDIKEQKDIFRTNGVYNFVLVQDGSGVSLPMERVHPYSGDYYIRLGLDRDYRSSEKVFRFSDYASKYDERFDHYFCQYTEGSDVRFCVACDYSECVSDTLVQEPEGDPHHDYTDANGKLLHNANVRFMWNSEDNSTDRAYLAGAGENLHLLSAEGIYNLGSSESNTDIVLSDANDWVYQADITADTGARVKLKVLPYNGATEYRYFKGEEGDFTNANTVQLIGGATGQRLSVRVIYDFKSNHLICAWLPGSSSEGIKDTLVLESDLILIREEHQDAQQITFSDDKACITKVSQVYGVISLPKTHFDDTSVSDNAKKFYWISFPYDVHLSEVFSVLTYGKDYIVKYYDGESRAREGFWADSPSFWRVYGSTEGVTLHKGTGYLLHVNINNIGSFFTNDNTSVNIYFPSANTDSLTISGDIESVEVPVHACSITRDHRNIYDSNWNLIGVPSWANINEMGLPTATEIEGISVQFLYDYQPATNDYKVIEAGSYNFGSMKAYMVQFAGTINWKEKTTTPAQKQMRASEAGSIADKTIRIELLRGEESLDHTYVQLSENEDISNEFDLNSDLTKIQNAGSNLYTLIGSEQIEAAANILPYSEQTIYVPLGVSVDRDGAYTFALSEEMEGMDVRIADAETGYTHNLLFSPYEVSLTAGTYTRRFSLEIHASSEVTTEHSETDASGERLRKVLLDGHLIIQRGEKVYDAQGRRIQ